MDINSFLKSRRLRITNPRKHIATLLGEKPLSAEEIHNQLAKQNIAVDLTSVYRTLILFVDLNIAQEVSFGDGKKRFELSSPESHHHHAICERCGRIEDIQINEHALLQATKKHSSFIIKTHSLEFFGHCVTCH